ncbi:MAG: hypothetical protein ABH822_00470 [Patescibacteria group bacterium]
MKRLHILVLVVVLVVGVVVGGLVVNSHFVKASGAGSLVGGLKFGGKIFFNVAFFKVAIILDILKGDTLNEYIWRQLFQVRTLCGTTGDTYLFGSGKALKKVVQDLLFIGQEKILKNIIFDTAQEREAVGDSLLYLKTCLVEGGKTDQWETFINNRQGAVDFKDAISTVYGADIETLITEAQAREAAISAITQDAIFKNLKADERYCLERHKRGIDLLIDNLRLLLKARHELIDKVKKLIKSSDDVVIENLVSDFKNDPWVAEFIQGHIRLQRLEKQFNAIESLIKEAGRLRCVDKQGVSIIVRLMERRGRLGVMINQLIITLGRDIRGGKGKCLSGDYGLELVKYCRFVRMFYGIKDNFNSSFSGEAKEVANTLVDIASLSSNIELLQKQINSEIDEMKIKCNLYNITNIDDFIRKNIIPVL